MNMKLTYNWIKYNQENSPVVLDLLLKDEVDAYITISTISEVQLLFSSLTLQERTFHMVQLNIGVIIYTEFKAEIYGDQYSSFTGYHE